MKEYVRFNIEDMCLVFSDNPGAWSNITTNYEIVDKGVGTTHSCFVTTSPSGEVTAQVRVYDPCSLKRLRLNYFHILKIEIQ